MGSTKKVSHLPFAKKRKNCWCDLKWLFDEESYAVMLTVTEVSK